MFKDVTSNLEVLFKRKCSIATLTNSILDGTMQDRRHCSVPIVANEKPGFEMINMSITVSEEKQVGTWSNVFVIRSTSGKLNRQKVYEALQKYGYAPAVLFLPIITLPDRLPDNIYDKGDEWRLYDMDDITLRANSSILVPIRREHDLCPICGEKVKPEWNFCPSCGQAFERLMV